MFVNNIWRHYKGGLYLSLGLAFHKEELVLYRGLNSTALWLRPKTMWFEKVNHTDRFTLCSDHTLVNWAADPKTHPLADAETSLQAGPLTSNKATHTETEKLFLVHWSDGEFKLEPL